MAFTAPAEQTVISRSEIAITRARDAASNVLDQSNDDRLIGLERWDGSKQIIVVASLNNAAFANRYMIRNDLQAVPDGGWKEVFNSAAPSYGRQNVLELAIRRGGMAHATVRKSGAWPAQAAAPAWSTT